MREAWNFDTFGEDDEDDAPYTLDEWLNLNSFCAKLLGDKVMISILLPLWMIREALEEEDHPAGERLDTAVSCVSESLVHGGKNLFWNCLLNDRMDKDEKRMMDTESGFTGRPGFNIERWGFWKRRLRELKGSLSPAAAKMAKDGIQAMVALERAAAEHCYGPVPEESDDSARDEDDGDEDSDDLDMDGTYYQLNAD